MAFKVFLPPSHCQQCINAEMCRECPSAGPDKRDPKKVEQALVRLFRYHLSGRAQRDIDRVRKELGLRPLGDGQDI